MKKTQRYKILILTLLLLSILPIISATPSVQVDVTAPLSNTNQTGSITIACNYSNSSIGMLNANLENSSFYINGTKATLATTSITNNSIGGTVTISSLTEGYNSISCVIGNTSLYNMSSTKNSSNVLFDSTSCTISQTVQYPLIELHSRNLLTCSASDNYLLTQTRVLNRSDGSVITISTSPYTLATTDASKIGTYTFTCAGSDYSGNTCLATKTFKVDTDEETITSQQQQIINTIPTTTSKSNNIIIIIILILVGTVIIVGLGITMFSDSKKHKRR